MRHGIHFISGLPRSGSTLLAGILRQNPRFHAGMTSPVGSMYMALEKSMSRRNETAVFIDSVQRRNAFEPSGMFGYESGGTVFSRIAVVAGSDGLVGYALDALKDGFFGEQAPAMILVEYDALVSDPTRALRAIYDFIGQPWFDHDFDNVEYDAEEFDLALGAPGLHTIRRKVEFIARETVLPPQLFHRFDNDMFWRDPAANRHHVRIVGRV